MLQQFNIILAMLEACDDESELRQAHKILGTELELIAKKSPDAMRPRDYIVCSFAFRYLCHSALESKISH
jgi:hypothetical protein